MNLETSVRPISHVKSHAAEMIRHVNETRNPIVITQNGEAKGVLVDPKTYQEMIDALTVLKIISQSERAAERGDLVDHDTVVSQARDMLKE